MRYFNLLMLLGLFAMGCRGVATSREHDFYSYDRKAITGFLKANNLHGSPEWVRRNNTGEKLYVLLYDKTRPEEHRVAIVKSNSISVRLVPGRIAFFNENEEVVAWSADMKEGVRFQNQFNLHLPPFAFFDVDPTGKLFIIGEKPNRTWIGNVDQPEVRTLIATNFLGRRIFSTRKGVVIAGSAQQEGGDVSGCMFIDRSQGDGQFIVTKTLHFPSFGGVIDFSPNAQLLVLQGRSDLLAGWYLYDILTQETKRLGVATGFGFFLNDDLFENSSRLPNSDSTR